MAPSSTDVLNNSGENRGADGEICGWRVQPSLNRMLKDGREVRLEPRIMQVLATLLAAGGEPVTRDELMQRIWGHEHVTEDALNRTVSKLRRVLADDLSCDAVIETIPKTGYRLIVPPTAAGSESAPTPAAASKRWPRHRLWIAAAAAVLVGIVVILWPRKPASDMGAVTTDATARLIPLTSLPGKVIESSLSPDGGSVAFAWKPMDNDQYRIYVRTVDTDSQIQISQGPGDDMRPVWAPDGSQIAFVRYSPDEKQCEVLSVPPVGGPARHLAVCNPDDGDNLAWTPDGKGLAIRTPGYKGLDLLTLADNSIRHLTAPTADMLLDGDPAFSPDGTWLAFTRWHAAGVADLHIQPVSGGEPKRITFDNLKIEGLTWEPDSRHLVYASNRAGPFSLWRVGIGGEPAERVPVSGRSDYGPGMSRDGRELVYEENNGQIDLFGFDPRAAGAVPQPITEATRWDWNPAPSPDGKRLAFTSDRSGTSEIWVADKNGENSLRLTDFGGPYTSDPAWSPDGQTLVFDSPAVDGNFDIYAVGANGGAPRRLTTEPNEDRFPHFSPDGKWIYFGSRRTGDWQIWRMPAGGGPAQQITQTGGYYSQVGADGSIYYSRITAAGIWHLAPGGQPELVVSDVQEEDCSNWVIAKGVIWYVQREPGGPAYIATHGMAAGAAGTRLAPLPRMMYKSGIGFAADGRLLYAGYVRDDSNLWMLWH